MFLTRTSCCKIVHASGDHGSWPGWVVSVSVFPITFTLTPSHSLLYFINSTCIFQKDTLVPGTVLYSPCNVTVTRVRQSQREMWTCLYNSGFLAELRRQLLLLEECRMSRNETRETGKTSYSSKKSLLSMVSMDCLPKARESHLKSLSFRASLWLR